MSENKVKTKLKEIGVTLVEAGKQWNEDDSSSLAASLAYFAIFSIVPLLIIISTILAVFYGQDAAQQNIQSSLNQYFAPDTTKMIVESLERASESSDQGTIASVFSGAMILFGASKVFGQLQLALNKIWNVDIQTESGLEGVKTFVKARATSFGMIIGLCFILLISLVLTTVIQALSTHLSGMLPGADYLWKLVNIGVSLVVYTLLFAALFKFVPDVELNWRPVWFGAAVTAVLFLIGQWGLTYYLANNSTVSAYGAAGAIISFLIWVYYSGQVVFYGAELTQVTAVRQGWEITPSEHAVWTNGAYGVEAGTQDPHKPINEHDDQSDLDESEAPRRDKRARRGGAIRTGRPNVSPAPIRADELDDGLPGAV